LARPHPPAVHDLFPLALHFKGLWRLVTWGCRRREGTDGALLTPSSVREERSCRCRDVASAVQQRRLTELTSAPHDLRGSARRTGAPIRSTLGGPAGWKLARQGDGAPLDLAPARVGSGHQRHWRPGRAVAIHCLLSVFVHSSTRSTCRTSERSNPCGWSSPRVAMLAGRQCRSGV
jgi:hypothetical protein